MALILTIVRLAAAVILRGAAAGTLAEVLATASRLVALLRPLLSDPAARQSLDCAADAFETALSIRPAQPEDPVFARQGRSKFGGR